MANRTLIRTATLSALLMAAGVTPIDPAISAEARGNTPVVQVAASEATSRFIPLGIGKSVAIDLPADIKDVLVADPKIANAVIRSSRRVYMIGVTVGQTNIFFFDADGRQIAGFDIAVTRDLNGVRAALKQTMPDADIRVEGIGDGVMLSGSAANAAEVAAGFRSRFAAGRRRQQESSTASPCAAAIRSCSKSRSPKYAATSSSSSASICRAPSITAPPW